MPKDYQEYFPIEQQHGSTDALANIGTGSLLKQENNNSNECTALDSSLHVLFANLTLRLRMPPSITLPVLPFSLVAFSSAVNERGPITWRAAVVKQTVHLDF